MLAIAAMAAVAVHARGFNMDDFSKVMNDVQSVVNNVGGTVQSLGQGNAYTPQAVQYAPSSQPQSSGRGFLGFSAANHRKVPTWGPKSKFIDEQISYFLENVAQPVVEWFKGLDDNRKILFGVLVAMALIVPLLSYLVLAPRHGLSSEFTHGVTGSAALSGVVFAIWGGFEIGGDVGEWLALAIMILLGISVVVGVLGSLIFSRGIFFRFFAPIALLEIIALVFVAAIFGTIVFIMIAIVIFVLAVFCTPDNTVYKCPSCGKLYSTKPTSCSCGATFR